MQKSKVKIKVKLFAILSERIGKKELDLELAEGESCEGVLAQLKGRFNELAPLLDRSLIARNGRYADFEEPLFHDDELAILPPVSGG